MAMRRPRKPPRPTGGKPPVKGGYPVPKKPRATRTSGFTGMGRKGTGRGFHGKPGNSTGIATGGGYHGNPPPGKGGPRILKATGGKPPIARKPKPIRSSGGKPPIKRRRRK